MERLDDLLIDNLKIYQRTDQFRFSIDAVILAHFVDIKTKAWYADFGTGTGVIPLLLTSRGATKITGIEINPIMVELAKKSVDYNHLTEKITILQGDYRTLNFLKEPKLFDHIVMNPPYRELGHGRVSNSNDIAMALHETETSFLDAIKGAKMKLKYGGSLWLIHLSERLVDVVSSLRLENLEPKKIRLVHSKVGSVGKFILVEARYGGKKGVTLLDPLYIYNEVGEYSEEVLRWYGR